MRQAHINSTLFKALLTTEEISLILSDHILMYMNYCVQPLTCCHGYMLYTNFSQESDLPDITT